MSMEDAFTILHEELDKIQGYTKQTHSSFSICCPFHDEKTPSCGINISYEAKVPLGFFNCYGCGAAGPWNKLAEKMGLRIIKEWQNFTGTTAGDMGRVLRNKSAAESTNSKSIKRLFEEVGGAVLPWPEKKEWRGYPGSMIKRVDGYMFNEGKRDELMLVLPVYINGRYRGGVKALWDKPEKGPSYLNTGGDWVQNYGLLGYDFVRKHELFGCDSVVLCEGPRDWLRLVLNKIPAIGILGSKMFGERKLMLLMGLGIKKIYTLTDNDSAGIGMARLVESFCENMIDFEELKLPRKFDEEGNLIKLDPDDASQKIIDKVKEIVYAGAMPVAPKKKKKVIATEKKMKPKLKIEQKTKRIGVKKK